MIYHLKSNDELVNKIREEKDIRWNDFTKNALHGACLTKEEVIKLFYDLQEYFNSDFPYEKINCDRNTMFAFDLICRASISMLENTDEFDSRYVTNNLCGAINHLQIKQN